MPWGGHWAGHRVDFVPQRPAPTMVRSLSADNLPKSHPFDLVFADPPYELGSGTAVAAAVAKAGWLPPGGWMAIETQRGDAVEPPDGWEVDATRDVGRARLTLLRS